MEYPKPGKYRHYKGNEYQLICIANHSETLETLSPLRLNDLGILINWSLSV